MEPYIKTGYMLEQAFHTLTNIDFFYSGDSFTQVRGSHLWSKTSLCWSLGPFVRVSPVVMVIPHSGRGDGQKERRLGFITVSIYNSQQMSP